MGQKLISLIEEKIFSVLDSENLSLIRDLIGKKH
jgi:hypothetical protein